MNPTEQPCKAPRTSTGIFASLCAFLSPAGTGAPSRRFPFRFPAFVFSLAFLAPIAASAVGPTAAAASECRPVFGGSIVNGGAAIPVSRTLTSVVLGGGVHGLLEATCQAQWTIEWSETGSNGPWQEFPGGTGTVTGGGGERAEFETGELTGLEPETTYYTRGILKVGSRLIEELPGTFEAKPLHPFGASVDAENSSITESSAHLAGGVSPSPFETQWRFEYSASRSALEGGAGTVVAQGTISQSEAEAAQTAAFVHSIHVEADLAGLNPNTTYYLRAVAEDEPEWPPSSGELHHREFVSGITQFETHGHPTAEASGIPALRGETIRLLGYVVPHGFDTHYRFQYGETAAYGSETAEEDAGSGGESGVEATAAAADLPGLIPGHTYHYRIIATGGSTGTSIVSGADHTVTVPVPGEGSEPEGPCSNQALRTGASARLPDCRAYEQVTPAEKGRS